MEQSCPEMSKKSFESSMIHICSYLQHTECVSLYVVSESDIALGVTQTHSAQHRMSMLTVHSRSPRSPT